MKLIIQSWKTRKCQTSIHCKFVCSWGVLCPRSTKCHEILDCTEDANEVAKIQPHKEERKKSLQCNSHKIFIFRPPHQENLLMAINLNPHAKAHRDIWATSRISSDISFSFYGLWVYICGWGFLNLLHNTVVISTRCAEKSAKSSVLKGFQYCTFL